MAFYPYVILDGYRYKTLAKQWRPAALRAATARLTLQGNLEATFGVGALKRWEGLISTPHGETAPGAADGTLYGNIVTLRASLQKLQTLPFTDHTGAAYTVVAIGPFGEQTIQNVWDAASNKYFIQVQLTAKAA
jgi:hypothetical protein